MPPDNSQRSFAEWTEADTQPDTGKNGNGNSPCAGTSGMEPPPASETGRTAKRQSKLPTTESPDVRGWKVYIVDAHSLIFQVFHALPEMSSRRGEHVGAVYGFVRDILQIIEQKKPDALVCAFDRSGPTFR